jgi:hypothetical protein
MQRASRQCTGVEEGAKRRSDSGSSNNVAATRRNGCSRRNPAPQGHTRHPGRQSHHIRWPREEKEE